MTPAVAHGGAICTITSLAAGALQFEYEYRSQQATQSSSRKPMPPAGKRRTRARVVRENSGRTAQANDPPFDAQVARKGEKRL